MEFRFGFFIKTVGMFINNFGIILVWYFFFQRFPEINGWGFPDMMILEAVMTLGIALVFFFGEGVMNMSNQIVEGHLDTYLLYPKNVLWMTTIRSTDISAIGDFFFSFFLLFLSGAFSLQSILIMIICGITGAIIMLSFMTIVHSMTFYFGNFDRPAWGLFDVIETLAGNPGSIYKGFFKLLTMTLFPTFFMTALPVTLIHSMNWYAMIGLVAFTSLFAFIAIKFFYRALRNYESGNLMVTNS
jgi:ABC-2 type transport system permease protein